MAQEAKPLTKEQGEQLFFGTPLLCFLDVLGFSSMVKNNSHKELLDIYKIFMQKPVDIMNQYAKGELEIFKKVFGV